MKLTWPPLQCERVGFEPNQQGHAASHEQASSKTPDIFQEAFFSSPARASALLSRSRVASVSLAVRMMSSSESTRCHYIAVAAGRSARAGPGRRARRRTSRSVIFESGEDRNVDSGSLCARAPSALGLYYVFG